MGSSPHIQRLVHPIEPARARALESFLAHKGSPWREDISRRVRGRVEGSGDRFFVAWDGSEIVGHLWYTRSARDLRLGALGHVFTDPRYRQRGIATRLFREAMTDFLDSGGTTMQLFTSAPLSLPFYERQGFENLFEGRVYHETDWYMRYPTPSSGLLDDWFRESPVVDRHLAPGDLPQYCLLYNSEHASISKNRAERIGTGLEAEYAFIHTSESLVSGWGSCTVLENDQTIVGAASLRRCEFPHHRHVAVFDLYLHRHFQAHAARLARRCLADCEPMGVDVIYAIAVDASKRELFAELGFLSKCVLANHFQIGSQLCDGELFECGARPLQGNV